MRLFDQEAQKWKFIVNAVILIFSFYSVSKRDFNYRGSSFFEKWMINLVAPAQEFFVDTEGSFSKTFNDYAMNIKASKENRGLKKEISEYQNKVFEMQEVEKENKRLKQLLGFGEQLKAKKVLAQIVSWDASSDFKVIRINKGQSSGVQLQSTVVTSEGLVGYVYRLTDHFADVLTIMDPNNKVDALVSRVRAHGILEGFSEEYCIMKYVTRTEPIILNDTIVTSGLGNIYPKGIKVGRVTRIERESYGITQKIQVSPAVDLGRLEEVIVLVLNDDEKKKHEWEALDESSGVDKR